MEPIDAHKDFLEALACEPYQLTEFLIRKQQLSGWSKDIYLQAMKEVLISYRINLQLRKNKILHKDPAFDKSAIGESLENLTGGRVKEFYPLRPRLKTSLLNKDVLETFEFYFTKACEHGEPAPVYSALQILNFTVKALDFILSEFEAQAGLREQQPFMRGCPKGFKPFTESGEPVYLLHDYLILKPTPLFDFHLFEEKLRELLLNSQHPENLAGIVNIIQSLGKAILKVWNEHLSVIEDADENTIVRTERLLSFDTQQQVFRFWTDKIPFIWNDHFVLRNYHLASFTAKVEQLVFHEGIEKRTKAISITNEQASFQALKDLFFSTEAYNEAMEALRSVKSPVISANNMYLLGERSKSVFAAWVMILEEKGKLKTKDKPLMAKLLNKEISNLDLGEDGSTLRALSNSAAKKYKAHLLQFISR